MIDIVNYTCYTLTMTPANPGISQLVADVRAKLKMNKAQFAQLVGVTPAAVLLWERGDRQPEGPALRLIYTLNEQMKQRSPKKEELDKVFEQLAVGAAAFGLILLLGAIFAGKRR